jgi:hypothetical protein
MTTNDLETPEAWALQLRMFLFGLSEGVATADFAETLVKRLMKCIPAGATEQISARPLIADLRGFIWGRNRQVKTPSRRFATISSDASNYCTRPRSGTPIIQPARSMHWGGGGGR